MRNRMPVTAALAAVLCAVTAVASGCGSGQPASSPPPSHIASRSPSTPVSSPSSGTHPIVGMGGPNIPAVQLGTKFTPSTLDLGAGQQFVVTVSDSVKASGSGIDGGCTAATAARFSSSMLSLRCDGGSYLYTTHRAGSTALSVTVRPSCAAGSVCPMWVAVATLRLDIS